MHPSRADLGIGLEFTLGLPFGLGSRVRARFRVRQSRLGVRVTLGSGLDHMFEKVKVRVRCVRFSRTEIFGNRTRSGLGLVRVCCRNQFCAGFEPRQDLPRFNQSEALPLR